MYWMTETEPMVRALRAEAKRLGLPGLRVQYLSGAGNPLTWSYTDGDPGYALRTVLPNEVVFDVGDRGNWTRCARTTHGIWTVLRRWHVPYWGAPSGGKGVHTHVFIDPHVDEEGRDLRDVFVDWVLAKVAEMEPFLTINDVQYDLDVDPVCLQPNPESRLVREFGHGKGGRRKFLWSSHKDPILRYLPASRDEVYKMASGVVPTEVPLAVWPPGLVHRERAKFTGKPCPQGPWCFPGPEASLDLDGTCQSCPLGM